MHFGVFSGDITIMGHSSTCTSHTCLRTAVNHYFVSMAHLYYCSAAAGCAMHIYDQALSQCRVCGLIIICILSTPQDHHNMPSLRLQYVRVTHERHLLHCLMLDLATAGYYHILMLVRHTQNKGPRW